MTPSTETTVLLVPQWQGAGDVPGLAAGARAISSAIGLHTREVALQRAGNPEPEHGIRYRASLLANLRAVWAGLSGARPQRVLSIGGDCSVELGPVSWLRSICGDSLCLVWLDAHADLNTPSSSPSATFHGMPLRHLLGEGDAEVLSVLAAPVSRAGVRLVGARSLDPEEQRCIEAEGLVHVGAAVRKAEEARALADRLVPRSVPLYLHVDLDILDLSDFAGLCCPEPDGWSPDALTAFCSRAIQRGSLVGMGVMEYLPRRAGELEPLAGFLDLLRVTAST